MKNLFQLSGVKALNKKEQQSVKGGDRPTKCYVMCNYDEYCIVLMILESAHMRFFNF
jgi:hypothetical protein